VLGVFGVVFNKELDQGNVKDNTNDTIESLDMVNMLMIVINQMIVSKRKKGSRTLDQRTL
jgi:hypothetical protein